MTPENAKKILSLIGLARRAGRVIPGADLTVTAVQAGKTILALSVTDASERTKKQLSDKCISHNVKLVSLPVTSYELGKAVGKDAPVTAVALTDRHIADGITKLLSEE